MVFSPHSAFPPPAIDPLKRLHVYDGLMMNARRWLVAEDYQRRRQSLQYQSVNQPGVVCGLGVRVIPAPESVDARFRDQRWIEIQPGVAIDLEGNPIVVDAAQDRTYRIDARPPSGGTLTIYIVVSYEEPANPNNQQSDETIREWFRFDQITDPPDGKQVELCRILLTDPVNLSEPVQFHAPQPNQLDFRYRLQAGIRSRATLRVGLLQSNQFDQADLATYALYQHSAENLAELLYSLDSLYPALQGELIAPIHLLTGDLSGCDLLFLPDGNLLSQFTEAEQEALQQYLQQGGGLVIEMPSGEILERSLLKTILPEVEPSAYLDWKDLDRVHPLRRTPFLFGSLADMSIDSIQLYENVLCWQGELAAAWGLADGRWLTRDAIRSAQELGINILNFFWQQRQLVQLTEWFKDSDEDE